MATNPRIYYPIQAIGFARDGTSIIPTSGFRAVKGVQRVGVNTAFALEPLSQLGQLSLYDNIENIPNIEITTEKVVDGYGLVQHTATLTATAPSLAGRYNGNANMMVIAYYPITNDAASGTPLSIALMSGVYVNGINWNLPIEGNITESVTLTCRDKTFYFAPSGSPWASGTAGTGPAGRLAGPFTGSETPILASGGAQRRQNVVMGSGALCSVWPKDIPGIDQINGFNLSTSSGYSAHLQNITIGVNLQRQDLFEQGSRTPYFRYATFPTQVTWSVQLTSSESGEAFNVLSNTGNLSSQTAVIYLTNGIKIDLGSKNKLQSITAEGGGTDGGNVTLNFQYSNYNDYICTATNFDPAGL